MEAPQLQLPWKSRSVDLVEAAYFILFLQLLSIFEGCIVPTSKAFDGFLQDRWYWLSTNAEPLTDELVFDNGDAARFAGFNLHLCPVDVFLEFIQQTL